jgi:hypothetical protein
MIHTTTTVVAVLLPRITLAGNQLVVATVTHL